MAEIIRQPRFLALLFQFLLFYTCAETAKQTHICISDPNERKTTDYISASVVKQQLIVSDDDEEYRNVVAKAILTREEVKELPYENRSSVLALSDAIFTIV